MTASEESGSEYAQRVETVRDAAKQTIALVQRLVADLKLDGREAEAARKWGVVLMPSPQKAE